MTGFTESLETAELLLNLTLQTLCWINMIVSVVDSNSITNIPSLPETSISSLTHIINLKYPGNFPTFPTFIKKNNNNYVSVSFHVGTLSLTAVCMVMYKILCPFCSHTPHHFSCTMNKKEKKKKLCFQTVFFFFLSFFLDLCYGRKW